MEKMLSQPMEFFLFTFCCSSSGGHWEISVHHHIASPVSDFDVSDSSAQCWFIAVLVSHIKITKVSYCACYFAALAASQSKTMDANIVELISQI